MPLYPEDLDRPLTRGDASLLGIGWREVSGPLWRSPYRGIHVWSATDPIDPLQRVLDAALLLPDVGAIGGWAAGHLGGATELDGRGASGQELMPVMVCLPRELRIRRGTGIRPLRSALDAGDVTEIQGIRVTRPLRTAFDIGRTESFTDAVAAIDYLARGRPEFLQDLLGYTRNHSRLRDSQRVLRALRHASCRSRSAGETRLRLFWTLEAGLPPPLVNPSVRLADDGFLVGMPDLLDLEAGMAGEYDGAGHREPGRHANDNAREEGFEAQGLVVVRFGGPDLGPGRRRSLVRLATGRRRGLATSGRPRTWAWEDGPLPHPTPHW